MKKLFLLAFAILCMVQLQAQNQTHNPYAGNFDVIKHTSKGTEGINVNFVLQPAPFINALHIDLNTPNAMAMSVKIVDVTGATVMNWLPAQVSNVYEHQFDISNLRPGMYKLEILGDANSKLHTVNFEKQIAATPQNSTRN